MLFKTCHLHFCCYCYTLSGKYDYRQGNVREFWRSLLLWTLHYLSQCWLSPLSPYGVTRPQWVWALRIWSSISEIHNREIVDETKIETIFLQHINCCMILFSVGNIKEKSKGAQCNWHNWRNCNVFLWRDPLKFVVNLGKFIWWGPLSPPQNIYQEPCVYFIIIYFYLICIDLFWVGSAIFHKN